MFAKFLFISFCNYYLTSYFILFLLFSYFTQVLNFILIYIFHFKLSMQSDCSQIYKQHTLA